MRTNRPSFRIFGVVTFTLLALGLLPTSSLTAGVSTTGRLLFIRGGPGTGGFFGGGADSHLSDINDTSTGGGNTGFGELKALLIAEGYTVDQVIEGPVSNNTKIDLTMVGLDSYDVVIFGSNNADYAAADAEIVRQFICGGGAALFISDANWGGNWGDAPSSDQTFLGPFDLVMNQDTSTYVVSRSSGDFVIAGQDMGTHPILAGPDGVVGTADDVDDFDGEGVSPLTITNLLPGVTPVVLAKAKQTIHKNDSTGSGSTAPATVDDGALIVVEYGRGRVAGHFDRNTFFNQNGAGTDLTRFDNSQYARNLFAWLRDASGPAYGVGCPGTGGLVPTLSLDGCPQSGENVTLTLANANPGAAGILLFASSQGGITLPGGCPLLLGALLPASLPFVVPAGGGFGLATTVPAVASSVAISMQILVQDPGGAGGIAATNGVTAQVF